MNDNIIRKKILFLCTGNSCRSQMAEGWCRSLWPEKYESYSAGITTHGLNPRAIKVMNEIGIDISGHKSENIDDFLNVNLDIVVTVCSNAHETCPVFKRGKVIHFGFDDPPALSKGLEDEDEILEVYRKVRNEIGEFIRNIDRNLEGCMNSRS